MVDSHQSTATLTMTRGPGPGTRFDIGAAPVTIGRQDQCDVQVKGTWVSRQHTRIAWSGTEYVVEDLGSTNGTFVNGERISGPRALKSGDLLQLGTKVELVFQASVPAPAHEEPALPGIAPSPTSSAGPPQPYAPPSEPVRDQKESILRRKGTRVWAMALLGLLLIVAIGAGIYYLISDNGQPAADTPAEQAALPQPTKTTPAAMTTTGNIAGMVRGDDGKPLLNINDQEVLLVALFCPSDDSAIECFHEVNPEIDFDALYDSICEAGVTGSNCLLHFGQGAVHVEADGSYTINGVPPGQFGLLFLYHFPELGGYSIRGYSVERHVEPVQVGKTTEYDIVVDFHRK